MKTTAKKSGTSAKAVVKPVIKPAVKVAVKAAVKAKVLVNTSKPAAKGKVSAQSIVKKSAKPVAAIPVKAIPVKAGLAKNKSLPKAAKPVVKAVPEKSAMASKAATKKEIKTPVRPTPKPPVKELKPSQAAKAPAVAKPIQSAKSASASPTGKKSVQPALGPAPLPTPRPAEKTMLIPAPPALKPGRRSSARALSQMPPPAPMVPTHAPDAAKASYLTMTERVIAPPPHVAAIKDPKLANNWKTKAGEALTDDEVKAMPDAEYMNEKQMAFFRRKLSVLKQEIHNSAGETTEHLREDTVVVPDPADRATIEEEHALELRTRDRERKLLKKIEQSIARIDSGDYGYCDETGEPIGVGRLIARPTANLSLEAQQRRELKQKMFGD